MKIVVVWIFSFSFLITCKSKPDIQKEIESQENVYAQIVDSIRYISDVENDFETHGEISNDEVRLNYKTIPKEEFLDALKRNQGHVRLFNRKVKINENLSVGKRIDETLTVGDSIDYIYLIDLQSNKYHRARNFFLEDKHGPYYIVKRLQFEDAETIIWNSKTNEEELILNGISASFRNSLLFHCNSFRVTPEDKCPVRLFKITETGVDALIEKYVDWSTFFSFFDKNGSSIYYIHVCNRDGEFKSAFARMDYEIY
ncbi:hypothetical protein EYV94_14730 [Puteibacter caeruleilacunae]|nr:hypothetical protein EYV94_14730 [Puteibacter caeruleilacunae]